MKVAPAILAPVDLAPFDALASDYDAAFTQTLLGRMLREITHDVLQQSFSSGCRVLDMGCGTGEDAIRLSAAGVRVHGIDASAAMIDRARAKAAKPGGNDAQTFAQADLNKDGLPDGPFDGALANFGVLNCVRDRSAFASRLSGVLRPGARIVLVVMGRYCPWEWIWYALRGQPRTAFRRLSGAAEFRGMPVFYPTPRELCREFEPLFRIRRTMGIGFLLPPTFAAALIERHPNAARILSAMERRINSRPWTALLSDHFLVEMERI